MDEELRALERRWLSSGAPVARLTALQSRIWRPASELDFTRLLSPRKLAGLYPHRDYDVTRIGEWFRSLFCEGSFFTASWAHGGGRADWEMTWGSAVGGVLGPLVGYVSLEARDSL